MENQTSPIPNIKAPKSVKWFMHIIPWFLIMCIPFLFLMGLDSEHMSWGRYLDAVSTLISFMLMFYLNYYYLISKYLFKRQTVRYLLMNLLLIVVLMVGDRMLDGILFIHPHPPGNGPRPGDEFNYEIDLLFKIGALLGAILMYSLVAAVSVAFKMTASWYIVESERNELERSRSEAELQNLKSQLNPHFLFNTLNNIYSLIALSPEKAQEAVHDLSRLLRYVMYESSQPLVPLEKDLDFIKNYVELMRIRLPEHAELKTDIHSIVPGTLIAPLLFISLIENAFKHGVSNNKPSFIHISITQQGNDVICLIENSDFHKDAGQDKSGSGIGLVNLERRLSLLYPDRHVYDYGANGNNYRVYLSITVNNTNQL